MISDLTKGKGYKTPEQVALLQNWKALTAATTTNPTPMYLVKMNDGSPYSVHARSHVEALEKALCKARASSTQPMSGSKVIICGPCRDGECSCGWKARVIELRWV
jgi:hypothetical protein